MQVQVWVLTKDYNAYDQYGSYYIKTFGHKPTLLELKAAGVEHCEHVQSGGGRIGYEDEWYNLRCETIEIQEQHGHTTSRSA